MQDLLNARGSRNLRGPAEWGKHCCSRANSVHTKATYEVKVPPHVLSRSLHKPDHMGDTCGDMLADSPRARRSAAGTGFC